MKNKKFIFAVIGILALVSLLPYYINSVLAKSKYENTIALCSDDIDNDKDNRIDLDDRNCVDFSPLVIVKIGIINDNGGSSNPKQFKITVNHGNGRFETGFTGATTTIITARAGSFTVIGSNPYYNPSYGVGCSGNLALDNVKECEITFDDNFSVSNKDHILVSEIQITGGSGKSDNDFIELWNPTINDINVSDWQLKKKIKSGSVSSIVKFNNLVIPSYGFLLWANSKDDFAKSIGADASTTAVLSDDYAIYLYDNVDALIDSVAWGENQAEGVPIPEILSANQSYERQTWLTDACHTATGDFELDGNGCDADDNDSDFDVRTISSPQNSKSGTEL